MTAEKPETLATSAVASRPVVLGAEAMRVSLEPAGAPETGKLAGRIAATHAGQKLYLVIKGLHTTEQPEVLYQVYLALPNGAAPAGPHYLGSFNFFNASTGASNAAATRGDTRVNAYDVTDLVKGLQARQQLANGITVTLVPAGKPRDGARPTIDEIALVRE